MPIRRETEDLFKVLPAAIAVLDLEGKVEVATETADQYFGLKPGTPVSELGYEWLLPLTRKALVETRIVKRDSKDGCVLQFIDNCEFFFQPMAVSISVGSGHGEPTGVALILKDVIQIHKHQEMKRNVISTVSHQLKTLLTSLRISIHLLLQERSGPLNNKQHDLLLAARNDSEGLACILNDLLNMNRIKSGK
jgi:NtrC-family two-component system sensor histidine kinase KinB